METVKSLHSGGVLMKPFQPAFLLKEIENRVKSASHCLTNLKNISST
jgi:hypothetical protein